MSDDNDDRDFDPILCDIMFDVAVRLSGRYVAWMDEAATEAEEAHWQAEHIRVMREAWAVDPDSRSAIEALTDRLTAEFKALPEHAPSLV